MIIKSLRQCLGNRHFAKSSNDRAAFFVLVFGGHLAVWYELFHVLPYYEAAILESQSGEEVSWGMRPVTVIHHLVCFLLYFGSFANLYKMLKTKVVCDISTVDGVGSSFYSLSQAQLFGPSVGWPFCSRCSVHQPPRTHHCPVCDVCVLRRDHHCWFAGSCVGHANQRYYIAMILNMFLAALYSNLYHYRYAVNMLGYLGWATPLCLMAPHVCAMFGWLSLHQFLVCALTFVALVCLVMFAWLCQIQFVQILAGQTKYERKIDAPRVYNRGLVGNIREVMGTRWYVAWLWPWIRSPLPSDGVNFITKELRRNC